MSEGLNWLSDDDLTEEQIRQIIASLFTFHYCPECGKILSEAKERYWSHDHSYSTGYKLTSTCVFCGYSEVYHDIE